MNFGPAHAPDCCQFGPFILDVQGFELRRNGKRLRLSASLLKLLVLFAEHPGQLLSRERIAACLWNQPEYVDVASGINTALNRLRTVLGDNPNSPIYLETVVGAGYRFIAPVTWAPREQPKMGPSLVPAEKPAAAPAVLPIIREKVEPAAAVEGAPSATPPLATAITPKGRRLSGLLLQAAAVVLAAALLLLLHRHATKPAGQAVAQTQYTFTLLTFNEGKDPILLEALSHNGRWLGFSDRGGLYVRQVGAAFIKPLPLPAAFTPQRITWVPGDEDLLVSGIQQNEPGSGGQQVWLVNISGAPLRLLLRQAAGAVASPDGQKIAYTTGAAEIWVSGAQGDSPRRLVNGSAGERAASLLWAPAQDRLIYQRCRAPQVNEAFVKPAGKESEAVCAYESIDARDGRLLATEKNADYRAAVLRGDGLLYWVRDVSSEEQTRAALFAVKTDTRTGRFLGTPELVSRLPGDNVLDLSSADRQGAMAALIKRRSSNVYVADISFPGPRLSRFRQLLHIAPDNYPHSWSSDGSSVLYESNDGGQYAIYQQQPDKPASLLARATSNAVLPQMTPDGQWVLFEDYVWAPGGHPTKILRVNPHGGTPLAVPTHGVIEDISCPAPNRNGDHKLCIVRERAGDKLVYYTLDPLLGEQRAVARMPWTEHVEGDWSVSPDGRQLILTNPDLDHPVIQRIALDGQGTLLPPILVQYPKRGSLRIATEAPDGRGYYAQLRTGVGYELLYVANNGKAVCLRQSYVPTWIVPSPNGKEVAFVDEDPNTNAWLITNQPPISNL